MKSALKDLWPLFFYFIIFIFTFTILGKEWFAYKTRFDSSWNVDLENGKYIDQNYNSVI